MTDRILILGASARAAAASARRAGLEPFAIDLFADADTRRICDCLRCPPDDYPNGLFRLARQAPPMPWMYTGGLENYPELVGTLARERDLWGNGSDTLLKARDLRVLDQVPTRELAPPDEQRERLYLRKPRRGSGGGGIRFARRDDTADPDFYYQEFIDGQPMSAVFVAEPNATHLLGLATQLVGTSWLHARGFQYAGNISHPGQGGPVGDWSHELCRVTRLRGLFGLDFISDRNRVVDVNPRYVASVEVHEFATGTSLLRRVTPPPPAVRVVGKAIYYAPRRLTVPASGPWDESLAHAEDVWRRPDFADIPHPDDDIAPGLPVLTLLAEAGTSDDCLRQLQSRAAELDRLFGASPCPP